MKYILLIASLLFIITTVNAGEFLSVDDSKAEWENYPISSSDIRSADSEVDEKGASYYTSNIEVAKVITKEMFQDELRRTRAVMSDAKNKKKREIRLANFKALEYPKLKEKEVKSKDLYADYTYETKHELATSQYINDNKPEYYIRYNETATDFKVDAYNGIECYTSEPAALKDAPPIETAVTCPKKNELEKSLADHVKVLIKVADDKIKVLDDTYGGM